MRMPRHPGPRGAVLLVGLLALFAAAPTAGDIGGCGQAPERLDEDKFFRFKKAIDCQACEDCGIDTAACEDACDGELPETSFPDNCIPVAHDGDVCLRALSAASCDDYATFMADQGATTPTECNFCPIGDAGSGAGQGGQGPLPAGGSSSGGAPGSGGSGPVLVGGAG